METLETGLIVNFGDSSIYAIEAFLENSDFYGYEIGDNKYLFPSQESEYNILKKALECEFSFYRIKSFTFEGV